MSVIAVPFHGAELFVVEHNGQPYTPMKPIVDAMGLAWNSQFTKIKQRFAQGVMEIIIPSKGGAQSMLCLPVRKLFGWLMTISPNKIPNLETRAKVIMYQNECDDVLWDYWTKGQAINRRLSITPEQQAELKEVVRQRAQGCRKAYAEMWARHNRHFKIGKYDQLLQVHFDDAKRYLQAMDLKSQPEPAINSVQMPLSKFQQPHPMIQDVQSLCLNMLWVYSWWQKFGDGVRVLNPNIANAVHDRFVFGHTEANMLLRQMELSGSAKAIYGYPWHESVEVRNSYWLRHGK